MWYLFHILELVELQVIFIFTLIKVYCLRAEGIRFSKWFPPYTSAGKCRMKTWLIIFIARYQLAFSGLKLVYCKEKSHNLNYDCK